MMALLVVMLLDLAHKQPVVFGIVMLAAFTGAIGLAYAIRDFRRKAYGTAIAALVVGVLGCLVHGIFESSYWFSLTDEISAQAERHKVVNEARGIVIEKRKERYASSAIGKSVDEIKANIEIAKQHERWTSSAGCTDATVPESRAFCEGYYKLQADLAKAREAGSLESVVWNAATEVEVGVSRDIAATAVRIAEYLSHDPRKWSGILVLIVVVFVQAVLALAFILAYSPEKRREPRTAPKAIAEVEPEDDPGKREPAEAEPPHEAQVFDWVELRKSIQIEAPTMKVREDPHRKIAFSSNAQFPQLAYSEDEPEAEPEIEAVEPPAPAKQPSRIKKAKAKNKKHKLSKQVLDWLCETTTAEPGYAIPSGLCFDNYVKWCRKEPHVGFRVFTGIIKEELGLDDAKRNNGGQTMLPIKLSDPKQWGGFAQRRKAA
jgi:hypothetical protein